MNSKMLSLVAKRNPCYLIHLLPIFNARHSDSIPLVRRFCSSSATQNPNFMVHYLISSFGFSPDKAATVSKRIAHVKSPEKPDSVLHFLKHHGFSDAQIKTIITLRPRILCSSPQNTLEPNLCAIRDIGLSNSAITQIILSDPEALHAKSGATWIKFWKDFFGGSEVALVTVFKRNRGLIYQVIALKISFLQSYGLTTHEIRKIMLSIPRFISRSSQFMEDLLHRAEELGFQPGTAMFVIGLQAVCCNSREALLKKMEVFKNFGWSENDFFSALQKYPTIVTKSEKNLQAKMEFLTGQVRCESSYIASNPRLLTASLEKRLRPRHNVLYLLDSKGLYNRERGFLRPILLTEEKFLERYILPHKEEISGLHQDYLDACAWES